MKNFIQTSKDLINEFGAEDVTASLIKILFDRELNFEYTEDKMKNDEMSRLFFSVGRLDNVSTRDLIKFLDDTAEVKSKELGRIDILDKFTFVDVPSNLVDTIISKSSGRKN